MAKCSKLGKEKYLWNLVSGCSPNWHLCDENYYKAQQVFLVLQKLFLKEWLLFEFSFSVTGEVDLSHFGFFFFLIKSTHNHIKIFTHKIIRFFKYQMQEFQTGSESSFDWFIQIDHNLHSVTKYHVHLKGVIKVFLL